MISRRTDAGALHELVGRLKVRELARAGQTSIEVLVEEVLREAGLDALGLLGAVADHGRACAEPAFAGLPGRATFAEVEAIVDRWVLGRVLEAYGGNVTHAAARLGISRRRLRTRWARVRELPAARDRGVVEPVGLAPPSLADMLERRVSLADIRETVGWWLVEATLARLDGNVTRSAAVLGISRAALRRRRRWGARPAETSP
jgi:DNA-binding protein Fis